MRKHSYLLFFILVLLLSGCLSSFPHSPEPNPTPSPGSKNVTLTGFVKDAGTGLDLWDGKVTIANQSVSIQNGTFIVKNIEPGTYTLTITKMFYKPLQKQVVIPKSDITINEKMNPIFTQGEIDLFARLVHAEAKGETYKGQVAVAATVLNRVAHPDYPNTLNGVINQVVVSGGKRYYQYEPVLNGSIYSPAGENAKNAVADALAGWDPSFKATGFFAPAKVGTSSWVWSRVTTVTIGNHRFFK